MRFGWFDMSVEAWLWVGVGRGGWIPAFAGMTCVVAGMTWVSAGMAVVECGNDVGRMRG